MRRLSAPRGDAIPNNDRYPALVYPGVLGGANAPADIHALYARNGWGGGWTWEVFPFHHFHPDAFEALAVASGSARLMLGGPQGEEIDVQAGDVIVLPPGYGHRLIEKRDGFAVCGAYPAGQEDYTTLRDSDGYDDDVLAEMRRVPPPERDPIHGLPYAETA
ncbi:cupin domain-containing protein [Oricola thermophila]|uniref:Cupin domain-containing protein n=1 Tax=Oricola thermophila TaxID=2742145 RepID=A0A6N1VN08_9HYPH|nr:cupin domain-containing protein [Oricola thermophila]